MFHRRILSLYPDCVCVFAVLSGLFVGCQDNIPMPPDKEELMEDASKLDPQGPHAAALETARQYVRTTKQWPEEEYHLEFLRTEGSEDAPLAIIDAVHHDDLQPNKKGGGKSVQLHVDVRQQRVIKELAYQ